MEYYTGNCDDRFRKKNNKNTKPIAQQICLVVGWEINKMNGAVEKAYIQMKNV